jgi:Ca2+/Na+ antiporter
MLATKKITAWWREFIGNLLSYRRFQQPSRSSLIRRCSMIQRRILALALIVLVYQFLAAIAPESAGATTDQNQEAAAPASGKKDEPAVPKVKDAWRILPENNVGAKDEAWLGQTIRVKVENLDSFRQTLCEEGDYKKGNCKQKDISLFLNRMELKGIRARMIDDRKSELEFTLLRREALPAYLNDPQQKSIWANLFGFQDRLTLAPRQVEVSVGPEGGKPLDSEAKLKLVRIHLDIWALFYICIILAMAWLYKYAGKKGAFSDRGPLEGEGGNPALSLARVQMGFWFFLVVAAFLFIWMVIGELPGIPASVLGLIGIAAGTALGAAAIDTNKRASASSVVEEQIVRQNEIKALKNEKDSKDGSLKAREQEINDLESRLPSDAKLQDQIDKKKQDLATLTAEINVINNKIKDLERKQDESKNQVAAAQRNKGAVQAHNWLADLLNDANGISFHRLQMVIWTLVLGIVFVQQVLSNLSLPDFDATLLALMGISSGTYLGFKLPEQQPKPKAQQKDEGAR